MYSIYNQYMDYFADRHVPHIVRGLEGNSNYTPSQLAELNRKQLKKNEKQLKKRKLREQARTNK